MTASLIHTLLFETPKVTPSGRIIRFDHDGEEPLTPLVIRRKIITYLHGADAPATAGDIADTIGGSHGAIAEQLRYLAAAEVVQAVDRKKSTRYVLVRYIKEVHAGRPTNRV